MGGEGLHGRSQFEGIHSDSQGLCKTRSYSELAEGITVSLQERGQYERGRDQGRTAQASHAGPLAVQP